MKSVRTALTAAGPKTRHTLAPDLIKLKTSATMAAELVEHSKIDARQGAQPMPIETNREIVRAIFDELARGNGKPFSDAMADDFQWTIKGTTA